jgi:ABC-type multidrug transport system fused ATPase/permease subunit
MKVLLGISFKVEKGQSVAFVGPSGCGKSTIFQLLQRFYDPAEGVVLVGGVDLRKLDVSYWRSQMGFVGQEPVLFDMSLADNVRYSKPDATQAELEKAAELANMEYVLAQPPKMRWEDPVGIRGGRMSGGQKQRCAIARAMLRDPQILILDEATSALDSASEGIVQDALDKASQGRTTFAIAHRLSTIRNSDCIFVLKAGQICEQGTHAKLIEMEGLYWNIAMQGQR